MTTLKQKTLHGLSWSFIDSFANQGITFLVRIVLVGLVEAEEERSLEKKLRVIFAENESKKYK